MSSNIIYRKGAELRLTSIIKVYWILHKQRLLGLSKYHIEDVRIIYDYLTSSLFNVFFY